MRIYEFIDRQKAVFPVKVLCRVCGVSRSAFYDWKARPPSQHALDDEMLAREIEAVWEASGRAYGAPRVWRWLKDQGFAVARKRVARLMAERGWRGRGPKRRWVRTTVQDSKATPAKDLVNGDFTATAPGELLVGDITYLPTWEGWLYLATVIDVYSRRVVGWSIADHMRADLVCDALRMANTTRGGLDGAIFHSDRGSQYTSGDYQELCARLGVTRSMGRTGVCWDNALAESFFATLKNELIYTRAWPTRKGCRLAVMEWIEGFYNRRRMHSSIGYLTPLEKERRHGTHRDDDQQAA